MSDGVKHTFLLGWTVDPVLADDLIFFSLGAIFAIILPFITRGMTMLHFLIAAGMFGRFRIAEREGEVADHSALPTAAVSAEDTALRRLELDIHDGPQQRLVRLQMDLAAAETPACYRSCCCPHPHRRGDGPVEGGPGGTPSALAPLRPADPARLWPGGCP